MVVELTINDVVESADLLCEAYEKDAISCKEQPNTVDIQDSLIKFMDYDDARMFVYKDKEKIKGVCGFIKTPSIVDSKYIQAIEIACNPLYSLSKYEKGKIFLKMLDKMEKVMKTMKINSFMMTIPIHFNSEKCLNKKGYTHKENAYIKEIL